MGRLLLLTIIFALYTVPALAISLRQEAVVQDSVIRLGDLFYGLERDADRVLGAAPRPGQTLTLSAPTLQRVAVALDLAWRPTSSADFLTVRRAATVVDETVIKDALRERFAQDFPSLDQYNLMIVSGDREIILPADLPAGVEISSFRYDADAQWFQADMAAPSLSNAQMHIRVSGKVEPLTQVPVLKSPLRRGDVIRPRDISMIPVPARSLNHDVVLDSQDLVGMASRRIIQPGRPITDNDLEEPVIVKKGSPVTMVYQNAGLRLTVKGRALEDGARGDMIRVTNRQSSRTIDATVSAPDEVLVEVF